MEKRKLEEGMKNMKDVLIMMKEEWKRQIRYGELKMEGMEIERGVEREDDIYRKEYDIQILGI